MGEISTFDKLVRELSYGQRKDLLERIERSAKISQEPLIDVFPEKGENRIQAAYENMSLFKKLILFLKALFAGKKKEEMLEEILLNRLKKQIAHQTNRLVDFRYSIFLEEMKNELDELAKAAYFFRNSMQKCLGKEKSNFIAFLGSFEMPSTHERLLSEINPARIMAESSEKQERNIKVETDKRLREIVNNIPEADRKRMYLESQALSYLYSFCTFPFEELLERFGYSHFKGRQTCEFSDLSKRLGDLACIMLSVVVPPTVSSLKAIFLFSSEENMEQTDFSLEDQLLNDFKRAEEALVKIRLFNRRIPLIPLLKIIRRNFNYTVTPLKGGEDWLALYKNYWVGRLDEQVKEFLDKRKINEIEKQALEYLELKEFPQIKYYHPQYYMPELRIRHWRSLGVIIGFTRTIYAAVMYRPLKILLVNGEFYKNANRVEYTDCFNFLNNLGSTLIAFEKKLLPPEGEYARKLEETAKTRKNEKLELKNTQLVFAKIDSEARVILDDTLAHLQTLKLILNGVLYSEMGGKYDTISNIGFIGGRENQLLLKDWEKILHLASAFLELLNNLRTIELSIP
jgi:hypothetical protein